MVQQDPTMATPADTGADNEVLTADEVIGLLRLAQFAPRNPREALRGLVRRGQLGCLRHGPGKTTRMIFLRRHVNECLALWERWGMQADESAGQVPSLSFQL